MAQLTIGLAALVIVVTGAYALGRLHGRRDLVETYQQAHTIGWTTCYRSTLDVQRQASTRTTPPYAANAAAVSYLTMPKHAVTEQLPAVG